MRLINMSSSKVTEYFKTNDIVIFSAGSLENHGYHNPVGVDTIIPEHILELINQKSDVLIAPTLPYGSADSHMGFPGTISLGPDVLYAVINKVVESLYLAGARRFLFLNGHGGNTDAFYRASLEWYKKGVISATVDWWTILSELNPDWKCGHGCKFETSCTMYVEPSSVDLSKVKEMEQKNDLGNSLPTSINKTVKFKGVPVQIMRPTISVTDNGWFGGDFNHPKDSSPELGKEVLTAVADWLVEFIEAFKLAKLPS